MTAHAINLSQRRGACPGLSAPLPTGDGLLVRLLPVGTIPLEAFSKLCAAAREHGNGLIEVTARGNIQVRGLSTASAPRFADAVAELGIAADDGIPILSNALSGLDPDEMFDAGALAIELRRALARRSLAARLGAKVSVVIDGGGALDLHGLAADVRLLAMSTHSGAALRVGVGGDGASAMQLGVVTRDRSFETVARLLECVAGRGRHARARDILATEGAAPFRSAIADLLIEEAPPPDAHKCGEAIGLHVLRDSSFAYGIRLAFGHADAASLERLAEVAGAAGAKGMRLAPSRALLTIGFRQEAASLFAGEAERLGFIVRANDPRRHIVACAGAPTCASAHIPARTIAPLIAETAAPHIDGSFKIHISGCAKGCAHPASAALTVVGTPEGCALIANGTTRDTPHAVVPVNELVAAIAGCASGLKRENGDV